MEGEAYRVIDNINGLPACFTAMCRFRQFLRGRRKTQLPGVLYVGIHMDSCGEHPLLGNIAKGWLLATVFPIGKGVQFKNVRLVF